MGIAESQLPERFRGVIEEQLSIFNQQRGITVRNSIPDTSEIPLDNQTHWLRIPDVICVYADMKSSTQLSAETADAKTAGAYQLFTGTAVRIFNAFDAPYIDVRGDGAFALFDKDTPYRAIAAAITFKTFAKEEFVPRARKLTEVEVGAHIGVDQKVVLVRRVGLRRAEGRTDRQNEVWAGKPVNMASKLASIADNDELMASDRYYGRIQHELVVMSCGCVGGKPGGEKTKLWTEVDVSDKKLFDFDKAHVLRTRWCENHGREYCEAILALDKD